MAFDPAPAGPEPRPQLPARRSVQVPRGVDARLRFVRVGGERGRAWLEPLALPGLAGLGLASGLLLPVAPALALSVALPAAALLLGRPRRGRKALAAAVLAHREGPEAGLEPLRALVHARVDPLIRLEAAGRLAAAHLDAGELGPAVAVLEASGRVTTPERGLGLGLIAELLRSLVTWLGVARFEPVAEAAALAPGKAHAPADERDRDDYLALLSVLELLEAHAGAPDSVLEAAWRRARATVLDQRFPGVALIAAAAVSARLPAARTVVEQAFEHGERSAWARATLAGLFPELTSTLAGELGYRSQAGDLRTLAVLALPRPPEEIRELVERFAERRERAGAMVLLGAAPVGLAAAQLAVPWIAPSLLAAGWLGGRLRRRVRARPVAAMPYGPPAVWLREIAEAPDAPAPLGDPTAPLRRDQLELYLCCVRAEQALARGEIEQAWDWVAWWFADRDYRKPAKVSLYPVAASLLRIAALSNRMAEARSLVAVVTASPARRLRLRRRTGYGDDPRALGHAKALVFARVCAWTEAAVALRGLASLPSVVVSERDEVLYVLVAQRVSAMSPGVDPRLCAVSPGAIERVRPWLQQVWPGLVSTPTRAPTRTGPRAR